MNAKLVNQIQIELISLKELKKKLEEALPFTEYARNIGNDVVYTIELINGMIERLQEDINQLKNDSN